MSNIFAVLDSDDEEEITPTAPVVTPAAKTAKAAPSISPVVSNKPVEVNARANNNSQNKGKKTSGTGAVNGLPAKTSNEFNSDVAKSHVHEANEGKGGKPHGGRRNDRDGNHENARKREYERHSGTGRGKEISKGGAGGHNWGNEKLEALTAEKSPADEVVDVDAESTPVAAEGAGWGEDVPATVEGDAAKPAEPAPEPEIPTFTLDEFLERRQQARANTEFFGAVEERTVSEEAFAGLRTKEVAEDEDFFSTGTSKASKKKEKEQRSAALKTQPAIELGFKNASLQTNNREDRPRRDGGGGGGGRGRGGRGGGEGGGGRGERRFSNEGGRRSGGYSRQGNGIDINDSSAFPAL